MSPGVHYKIKTLSKHYCFDKPRKGEEEGLGTEKRVDLIRPEMERKLRKKDMKYFKHDNKAKGTDGPLVARFKTLNFQGIAIGKYADVSKSFRDLITTIADHGALVNWKKMNFKSEGAAKGVLHFHLRKMMGMLILKSGARLLLSRLPLLSGTAQLSQQRVRASQRNTFGTSLALFGSVYQWKGNRRMPTPFLY